VDRVAAVEQRVRPGSRALQDAVARNYFQLLAYKDEYEVARLHTETGFLDSVRRNFGAAARPTFHFSPPLFAGTDPADRTAEEVRDRSVDRAGAARARETALAARQQARSVRLQRRPQARASAAPRTYERVLERLVAELDDARFEIGLELARLPNQVRGYGRSNAKPPSARPPCRNVLLEQWAAPAQRERRGRGA